MPVSAAGNHSDWRSKPLNNKSVNTSLQSLFIFSNSFFFLSHAIFYSAPSRQRPCIVIKSEKQQWFTDFSSAPVGVGRRRGGGGRRGGRGGGGKKTTTITLLSSIFDDVAVTVLSSRSRDNNAACVLRRRRRMRGGIVSGAGRGVAEQQPALTSPGSTAGRP